MNTYRTDLYGRTASERKEYRAAIESELGMLSTAHPDRYHRFLFDSPLHTTIGTDSVVGGGLPGVTATYDETLVAGTSVSTWLELLITDDPAFGDRIE